ncbi:MAG: hypothetical protein ACUVXA_14055 [Candidatus Jordarchaeum sp.]|uniref:hypothetical protein n=1 Tax=Candidatus Jordarchaeum sp. TaxID=2823881 RepID=UPI00404A7BF1
MYVLEILDNWAKLQEREVGKSPEKSRFAKNYDFTEKSKKLVKQPEFLQNSAVKSDKPKFKFK